MLPKLNNKSFLECTEEDFESLIENLDYRENEYIDYKKNFAFLEIPKEKKAERNCKIAEFRSDVCSFANADYFDISIEQLMYGDEISIRPSVKKREQMFKTMYATPQRWASLRRGDIVEVETILNIMKYVNCSLHFLNSSSVTEYAPEKEYDEKILSNSEILFDILDIMDACADSDAFRDLQI